MTELEMNGCRDGLAATWAASQMVDKKEIPTFEAATKVFNYQKRLKQMQMLVELGQRIIVIIILEVAAKQYFL